MAQAFRQPCDEGVIRSTPTGDPRPPGVERWILATTILGSSMAFIDGSVVNVALPALQQDLKANVADLQWVVEAYALSLAALLLVGGALGDRYGRRKVYISGVTLFALTSAWCGLAPNVGQLIVARAIQGIGAALLVPGSLAIIGAYFGKAEQGHAIGTWSGFTAITTAMGPVLGGWLVEHNSWRAAFFVNLPLAFLVVVFALKFVPESRAGNETGRLDWVGALTAALGLGLITYGLLESGSQGLGHPALLASVALGLAVIGLFVVVEAKGQSPMIPLWLFRSPTFSGANLLTLLLYAALSGVLFFLPLNLIQVQGYSPAEAGAAFLPFVLIMSVLGQWSGGLVSSYGPRPPLVIGPTIAAVGFSLFALPSVGGSYWTTFFPATVVMGFGMAVTVAPLTTTVMTAVGADYVGVASGINNAMSRVGGLLAIALFGVAMLVAFNQSLDRRLTAIDLAPQVQQAVDEQRTRLAGVQIPAGVDSETGAKLRLGIDEAFTDGFRVVVLIASGLALASAAAAGLTIDGARPNAGE